MERQPDSEKTGPSVRMRRSPLWLRLSVAIAGPVLFVLLLELGLRLAGYGYASGFFLPWRTAGETVYLTNEHYCEHFVPKELSRAPEAGVLTAKKGDSTLRVFVLGGSAAYGDPEVAFGFCRQLEVLLNAHSTQSSFEVINAAVTAMNSHVARRIAADCASYAPDAFIVFMGNNEVVGPYGPPTLPEGLYANRGFLNLCITAKKDFRLGQLIDRTGQTLRSTGSPKKKWLGMEAFLDSQILRDDPRLQACYSHLEDNIRDIARTAQRCGAKTILCTVPANIRSCAPFASKHKDGLSADQLAQWESLFQQGRDREKAGDFEGALEAYDQARTIDDEYADLAFCRGTCLRSLERIEEAREAFAQARDLDTLRFRADSHIEKAIRQAAETLSDRGVSLCDLKAILESRSQDGLLGDDLLLDHVHLNFRGNFLAAMAAMAALRHAIPEAKLSEPQQSEAELLDFCRDRLLFNNREMYDLAMVMYRRKTLPPFAGQITHDVEMQQLREALFALRRMTKGAEVPEAPYLAAVDQAPLDTYVNIRYGQFLVDHGRIGDAIRGYQKVLQCQPYNMNLRLALARAYAQGGMKDQAIETLTSNQTPYRYDREQALLMLGSYYAQSGHIPEAATVYEELNEMDSDNVDVLINLASAASHRKDYAAMKQNLDKVLKIDPESVQARVNMGNYYAKQNQPAEAQKWFVQAVKADPQNYLTHIGLGIQSIRLGQMEKGIEHVREAVILKPDFVEGYQILAAAYVEKGDRETATKYAILRDLFRPPAGQPSRAAQ